MTVLGPDSDWYHEEHIHLDLSERRSNYRICQWDVLDPLPQVAPLLPAVRPEEAPPREVAKGEEKNGKDGRGKDDGEGCAKEAPADKHAAQPEGADENGTAPDTDDTAAVPAAPAPAPAKGAQNKSAKKKRRRAK